MQRYIDDATNKEPISVQVKRNFVTVGVTYRQTIPQRVFIYLFSLKVFLRILYVHVVLIWEKRDLSQIAWVICLNNVCLKQGPGGPFLGSKQYYVCLHMCIFFFHMGWDSGFNSVKVLSEYVHTFLYLFIYLE